MRYKSQKQAPCLYPGGLYSEGYFGYNIGGPIFGSPIVGSVCSGFHGIYKNFSVAGNIASFEEQSRI